MPKITIQDAKINLLEAICRGLSPMDDLEPWLGDEAEDFDDEKTATYQRAKASLVKEFGRRIALHRRNNKKTRDT
jgi:hypothetical protein